MKRPQQQGSTGDEQARLTPQCDPSPPVAPPGPCQAPSCGQEPSGRSGLPLPSYPAVTPGSLRTRVFPGASRWRTSSCLTVSLPPHPQEPLRALGGGKSYPTGAPACSPAAPHPPANTLCLCDASPGTGAPVLPTRGLTCTPAAQPTPVRALPGATPPQRGSLPPEDASSLTLGFFSQFSKDPLVFVM